MSMNYRDHSRSLWSVMHRRTPGLAVLALGSVALGTVGGWPTVVRAQQPAATPPVTRPLVFDGVTVVDVEQGQLLKSQRVVIVGNRIQAMGSAGAVHRPKGAQIVDARGKYLIPGLWDMHTHSERATDLFYPLFIANGVTGIRDAGSPVPLDTMRQWRREILAGTRVGPPRQLLSGQSIAGPEPGCNRSSPQWKEDPQTCVADSTDARRYVDSLKAAGADMIKPRAVDRALYFVIAAEARRVGIPFGGHAQELPAIEASDSGASIVDHMQIIMRQSGQGLSVICWGARATVEQCQPVAEHFRHNRTWLVPTLVTDVSDSLIARFTKRAHAFWAGSLLHGNWLRDSAGPGTLGHAGAMHIMQRVGLPIMAGTDVIDYDDLRGAPAGFALHEELAIYAAEGLTPLEALQAATLNPAKLLHATDSLGTVAPGKLADLVLLDADPLVDITNTTTIHAVIANGRYFDRAALDQVLADVQAKSKQWLQQQQLQRR